MVAWGFRYCHEGLFCIEVEGQCQTVGEQVRSTCDIFVIKEDTT